MGNIADIAAVAFTRDDLPSHNVATGFGVRLTLDFVLHPR